MADRPNSRLGSRGLAHAITSPGANPHRDGIGGTPADPPLEVTRACGPIESPQSTSKSEDEKIVAADDYAEMRGLLEDVHDNVHGFVAMGGQHISFRDPFVFLLHSNVDRLFALSLNPPIDIAVRSLIET